MARHRGGTRLALAHLRMDNMKEHMAFCCLSSFAVALILAIVSVCLYGFAWNPEMIEAGDHWLGKVMYGFIGASFAFKHAHKATKLK